MLCFCGDKPDFVACLSALLSDSLRFNWQSEVFWLETNLLPQTIIKKKQYEPRFSESPGSLLALLRQGKAVGASGWHLDS